MQEPRGEDDEHDADEHARSRSGDASVRTLEHEAHARAEHHAAGSGVGDAESLPSTRPGEEEWEGAETSRQRGQERCDEDGDGVDLGHARGSLDEILGTLDEISKKANAGSVPAPMLAEDRSDTIQMTNS